MKNITAIRVALLLILTNVTFYARAQISFEKLYGTTGWEESRDIIQTNDGGYVSTGFVLGGGFGNYDIYVVKTDSLGVVLWTKIYGAAYSDQSTCIRQTADGGFIICGNTFSYNSGASSYAYLIKTDIYGNVTWSKVYGSSNINVANSLVQTVDGGYICVGSTSSFGAGMSDMYIFKTDSLGNMQWNKTIGGVNNDYGNSVVIAHGGGYIIAGTTSSFGSGNKDAYIVKVNNSGNIVWEKTFGDTGDDEANSIQRSNSDFVIAGSTTSFGAVAIDIYILKINSIGSLLWSRTIGGADYDIAFSARTTAQGGYILGGYSYNIGISDINLIKTDKDGFVDWIHKIGGSGAENSYAAQQTTDGGYIIAGSTSSFPSLIGHNYIIKTDATGNSPCSTTSTIFNFVTPTSLQTNPASILTSALPFSNNFVVSDSSIGVANIICPTTDITEDKIERPYYIYPNPSSGNFTLEIYQSFNQGKIEITNSLGKVVYTTRINNQSEKEIKINDIEPGVYYLSLWGDGKYSGQKLIIK